MYEIVYYLSWQIPGLFLPRVFRTDSKSVFEKAVMIATEEGYRIVSINNPK